MKDLSRVGDFVMYIDEGTEVFLDTRNNHVLSAAIKNGRKIRDKLLQGRPLSN